MTDLERKIQEASQKYYTDGSSELTDSEWDELVDELRRTNPESPILRKIGWGYSVDKDSTAGQKYSHIYGLVGSLDKCRTWKELRKTLRNGDEVYASLKLDGISVVLYYKHGRLIRALTRGDGTTGIDITSKVLTIDPTLKQIQNSGFTGAIRGEILMPIPNFTAFNKIHPEAKNPRNSTAGIMNSKEVNEDDLRKLNVVVYSIVGYETSNENGIPIFTMSYIMTWLNKNFNHVVPYSTHLIHEDTFMSDMNWLKHQFYGYYPADGIVLSTDNLTFDTTKSAVIYDSQAFKFPSEKAESIVTDVEWNLSKTRYLIPKVKIQAVRLSGTTVQYATGFHAKYIKENGIGKDAIVEVEKHGEIIPNINKVVSSVTPDIPKICLVCGTDLIWQGVHLACPNQSCDNADRQDLSVWLENIAPVEGLGDAIKFKYLEQFFGKNLSVESVMYRRPVVSATFSTRSTHKTLVLNMMKQLSSESRINLVNAIKALNIPRFGDKHAERLSMLSKQLKRIVDFLNEDMDGESKAIEVINSIESKIGVANAESLRQNLRKLKRLNFIRNRIVWEQEESIQESRGKVAITGKLSCKRSDFEKELRSAGFVPGEISKDTKFLITDNPNSSSSKNKKADEWGIEKITESEFRIRHLS